MSKLIRSLKKLLPERARLYTAAATAFLLGITACELNTDKEINPNPNQHLQTTSTQNSTYNTDADTVETATMLAYKLPNPYTVPNMRQAYQNMYGGSGNHIVATHQYVRFKPANKDQFLTLIETLDLELYDTPLDYKIAYEGDYYQDPSIPNEEITWQYTVVPVNFTFPSGIQYELLSSIHIPSDANDLMEAEAERLVGLNADGDDYAFSGTPNSVSTMDDSSLNDGPTCPGCETPMCAPGYMWDPNTGSCVEDTRCPSGYVWDDTVGGCVSFNPPKQAGGRITVDDTNFGQLRGVRNVRVVAKRWFKIERMFTDNTGLFISSKKFRSKVKVIVKFKNSDSVVKHVRGARFWEMLDATKVKLGTFPANELNNINRSFLRNSNIKTKGKRNWAAATIHNSVQEFKEYAQAEGTAGLPGKVRILMSNSALSKGGSAPMFAVRLKDDLPSAFVDFYIASSAGPLAAVVSSIVFYLKSQVDITTPFKDEESDQLKETMYHELAHASLLTKAGINWYNQVVNASISEMIFGTGELPYRDGNSANSAIMAVNEGWAYYYGHHLAGLHYTSQGSCVSSQRSGLWFSRVGVNCGTNSPNPHWEAIENFNPLNNGDPFQWIPKGLFNDLRDDNNVPDAFVNDQVFGFSNQQMINAIDSDITSPQDYYFRLLQENNNFQATGVNTLFTSYGY